MQTLEEVKSWMRFWGWSHSGGPGAAKFDADGNLIGRHGDETWQADVAEAEAKTKRLAASR